DISLNGFNQQLGNVTAGSYGIPQDEAARTNAPFALQDIEPQQVTLASATNFTYSAPPLSLTLVTLEPVAQQPQPPVISIVKDPSNNNLIIETRASSSGTYALHASTNLLSWTLLATNSIGMGSSSYYTNLSSDKNPQFYRAELQQ